MTGRPIITGASDSRAAVSPPLSTVAGASFCDRYV